MLNTSDNEKIFEKRIGERSSEVPPKVSIITAAYNCSELVAETLESVFAQTFTDYEIILVNDGSTDTPQLEQVLEPYFSRITYIRQENKGIARTRNLAINEARGEYLAFLDSDDIWMPEYLEKQVTALAAKKCDLIYTDAYLFGEGIKKGTKYTDKAPSTGKVTTVSLISTECNVLLSGTVVSREKVLAHGAFDKNVPWMGMEDFDLWFRLAKNGVKLDYQSEVLAKYRVHSKSISGSRLDVMKRTLAALEHLEKTYDLTESEKNAAENAKKHSLAMINVEQAKLFMIEKNYPAAIDYFQKANSSIHRLKLSIVINLLKISPKFLMFFLKKIQPDEYCTIATNRK